MDGWRNVIVTVKMTNKELANTVPHLCFYVVGINSVEQEGLAWMSASGKTVFMLKKKKEKPQRNETELQIVLSRNICTNDYFLHCFSLSFLALSYTNLKAPKESLNCC